MSYPSGAADPVDAAVSIYVTRARSVHDNSFHVRALPEVFSAYRPRPSASGARDLEAARIRSIAMIERDLAITFAGGGNRAFYQLGLLNQWGGRLWPRVGAVAACSAGACVVAMIASGRERETSAFWRERRAHVTRNFEWSRLLRGRSPAPHGPIYRDTLLYMLADGGLDRIRALPFPLLVLASAFPRLAPAPLAVALGIGAYQTEKRLRPHMIHPSIGRAMGFQAVRARRPRMRDVG